MFKLAIVCQDREYQEKGGWGVRHKSWEGGGAAGDSRTIGASCIRKIQVLMLNDQIKRLKFFRFCGSKDGH